MISIWTVLCTWRPTASQKQQQQQNKYPAVSSERWYRDNVTEDPEAHLSDGQRDGIPSSGQIMP